MVRGAWCMPTSVTKLLISGTTGLGRASDWRGWRGVQVQVQVQVQVHLEGRVVEAGGVGEEARDWGLAGAVRGVGDRPAGPVQHLGRGFPSPFALALAQQNVSA